MKQIKDDVQQVFARMQANPRKMTAAEEQAERRRQEEAEIQKLQRMNVPRRLWGASVQSSHLSKALEQAQKFIETEAISGHCLILAGPTGVGKTYAAVAALRAWPKASRRFIDFTDLCSCLMDNTRRTEALEQAKTTHFVVFDDVGAEYLKPGSFLDAFIDAILCHRDAQMLPTIITTNLTPEQLKERFSDRIVDRLRGDWGRIYTVPGLSLRYSQQEVAGQETFEAQEQSTRASGHAESTSSHRKAVRSILRNKR